MYFSRRTRRRGPPTRKGGGKGEKLRALGANCIPTSRARALPRKLRRQATDPVPPPSGARRGSNPEGWAGSDSRALVSHRGPARLAPTEFHKESLPARAPHALTGACACGDSGSRRLRLRAGVDPRVGSRAGGGDCSIPSGTGPCPPRANGPASYARAPAPRAMFPPSRAPPRQTTTPQTPRTRALTAPAPRAPPRTPPPRKRALAVPPPHVPRLAPSEPAAVPGVAPTPSARVLPR